MSEAAFELSDNYWLLDLAQSLDVGLIVMDLDYKVTLWNDFMSNHYGEEGENAVGKSIFDLFDDLPDRWFKRKVEAVVQFKGRAFTTWEQRPYVLRLKNYRPFTSTSEYMYQNTTIVPLKDMTGQYNHIGIIVYDVTDVALQRIQLQTAKDELSILAKTDALTGLNNRGHWEERLNDEFNRYRRTRQSPTLIMLDIDHFKLVNDTYGHPAGDTIIRMLADTLTNQVRSTDIVGRLGGEEYGVILVDCLGKNAEKLANRIRQTIEDTVTEHDEHVIRITSSFGVCELTDNIGSATEWLAIVDEALYDSKKNGRNCVSLR